MEEIEKEQLLNPEELRKFDEKKYPFYVFSEENRIGVGCETREEAQQVLEESRKEGGSGGAILSLKQYQERKMGEMGRRDAA